MALSDHGQYSGVVDIARNGIDEVIRLKAQAKDDEVLILQLVEALTACRANGAGGGFEFDMATRAIKAGRARLERKP